MALVVVLLLASSRRVGVYDEGIVLTGAMRVLAGQVVHRDFYYNYGPATVYLLAGLFKVFGPSVLAERLLALCGDSLLILSVYAISRAMVPRRVALAVAGMCFLWVFGFGSWSLLEVAMLWSTWWISGTFSGELPFSRSVGAGLLVGVATLFRYDMGVALAGCHLLTAGVGAGLRTRRTERWAGTMLQTFSPYTIGATIVIVPVLWADARAGAIPDLRFDIVGYTAKYYRVGRRLPFPGLHRAQLQDLAVYALLAIMGVCLYVIARRLLRAWREQGGLPVERCYGAMAALLLVAAVTYAKGIVRISAAQMTTSAELCMVLCAPLYELRATLPRNGRAVFLAAVGLLTFAAAWSGLYQLRWEQKLRSSMALWILEQHKADAQAPFDTWCRDKSPLTHGLCYTMDGDHIQTIEFLEAHTRPGDTLYVGLPDHDRIYINDNMTYFATWRLPATKWSHFDPFLQNSAPTQQEMIGDLERERPPYVVLDSEFDAMREPNGSSVHTGVHLLDEYIAQHYHPVQRFGEMTILHRTGA